MNYIKQTYSNRGLALAVLLAWVVGAYDSRIMLVLGIEIVIFAVWHILSDGNIIPRLLSFIKRSLLFGLGVITLNAFWILPFANLSGLSQDGIFNRGLFGNDFFNSLYALIGKPSNFTVFGQSTSFINKSIFILEWLVPLLAFYALYSCLLYTSPSPRDRTRSRMPSSA